MSIFPTSGPRRPNAPPVATAPAWFATSTPGLEAVTEAELRAHPLAGGLDLRAEPGGVAFHAPLGVGARLATELRTPGRLLLRVGDGKARTLDELARLVRGLDWAPLLDARDPGLLANLSITVSNHGAKLRYRDRCEEKVRHALTDALRGPRKMRTGDAGPAQHLLVRLEGDRAELSLCAGGELLHKRGWRQDAGGAPLRENLAAALLWLAGWAGDEPLLDPFCGAGTIPIEAALMAAGRSPFVGRKLACEAWPGVVLAPPQPAHRVAVGIEGSDRDGQVLAHAVSNARRAGVQVRFTERDVSAMDNAAPTGLVVANPPYGHRLGQDVREVYNWLGRRMRGPLAGWRLLFLCPTKELAHLVDRDATLLTTFQNGGLRIGAWAVDPSGAALPGQEVD